ncbi:MAG: nickel pincer cofactor biosynthesis protein LarC [Planctomycetes bacterium]|nr:nickel pincer cofactor biosynthesis protein LarC [Planctomycetota bacterium]
MKIALFDCPAGVAGDMWVGACVDAGVEVDVLRAAVASLELGAELRIARVLRAGLAGTQVLVVPPGGDQAARGLAAVLDILARADVPPAVTARAGSVFESLADVESRAHGIAREAVHFHELGAVDTIVDVLCACLSMHQLGVERSHASVIEVGNGVVRCAHGLLPVPAPGTAGLMHGFRQCRRLLGERTTPTGAALLREFVTPEPMLASFRSMACGYGAGARDDAGIPNLLRLTVAEVDEAHAHEHNDLVEIACNLDTADGESLAWIVDGALERGALDAWVAPVTMKKGRPGHVLHVLAGGARRPVLENFLLEESTTLGVRKTAVERTVLERWSETVDGPFGPVLHKCARLPSGRVVKRPEDQELRRVAAETGLPRRTIVERLAAARAGPD